jgi:hypothetical protein
MTDNKTQSRLLGNGINYSIQFFYTKAKATKLSNKNATTLSKPTFSMTTFGILIATLSKKLLSVKSRSVSFFIIVKLNAHILTGIMQSVITLSGIMLSVIMSLC